MDGDTFYNFVCTSFLSKLMPFNGTNENSVLILDNCSVHNIDEVLSDCGVITHNLPPYTGKVHVKPHDNAKHCPLLKNAAQPFSSDYKSTVTQLLSTATSENCLVLGVLIQPRDPDFSPTIVHFILVTLAFFEFLHQFIYSCSQKNKQHNIYANICK